MTTAAEKLARLVLDNLREDYSWAPATRKLAREVLDDAAKGNAKVIKRTVAQPDPEGPFAPQPDYETADRLEAGVEYEVLPDDEPDAGQREDPNGLFVAGHRFRADGTEMVWGQMPYAGRHYFALRVGTGLQRVRRVTPKADLDIDPDSLRAALTPCPGDGSADGEAMAEILGGPGPHAAEIAAILRRLDVLEAKADRKVPRY